VEYLHRFEKDTKESPESLRAFISWLNQQIFENHVDESGHEKINPDMELTFLLIMQNKHYKMYCKDALADTEIKSPDEYSFLYHLSLADSFRKMELIHIHLLEAPSGIEVIKRLLKKGFIEEFDDAEDKRAKRVRLTVEGRQETEKLIPRMQQVYTKMTAEMSLKEKMNALAFLRKLNAHHSDEGHKK
jgi:DNA-binding MarR family transcriptional regulator